MKRMRLTFSALMAVLFCSNMLLAEGDPAGDEPKSPKSIPDREIFHFSDGNNLIKNGDFRNGTTGWVLGKYDGASAILMIDSTGSLYGKNSALINISSNNKKPSDIRLFQDFPVDKHATYSMSFQAKVKAPKLVTMTLCNDFKEFWSEEVMLVPGKLEYGPFTFESEEADYTTSLALNLGGDAGKINIDAVSVTGDFTHGEFEKILSSSGINVFPNPADGYVHINLPIESKDEMPVTISDLDGHVVQTTFIQPGTQELVLKLQPVVQGLGYYVLNVYMPDRLFTKKIRVGEL